MVAQMASVVLPRQIQPTGGEGDSDALHLWLRHEKSIEVPVFAWRGQRLLRISAQAYNSKAQYERLAAVLAQQLAMA